MLRFQVSELYFEEHSLLFGNPPGATERAKEVREVQWTTVTGGSPDIYVELATTSGTVKIFQLRSHNQIMDRASFNSIGVNPIPSKSNQLKSFLRYNHPESGKTYLCLN
jgi:hypothetical protein